MLISSQHSALVFITYPKLLQSYLTCAISLLLDPSHKSSASRSYSKLHTDMPLLTILTCHLYWYSKLSTITVKAYEVFQDFSIEHSTNVVL